MVSYAEPAVVPTWPPVVRRLALPDSSPHHQLTAPTTRRAVRGQGRGMGRLRRRSDAWFTDQGGYEPSVPPSGSHPGDDVHRRRRYVEGELQRAPRLRWRRGRSTALRGDHRPLVSRVLHRLGDASAHAAAGLIAMVAVLGWIIFGVVIKFPDWWETTMYVTSSAITLVMVFAIQHTQSRQQMATQRKLDELVRSMPNADNRLIAAESASDEELNALGHLNATDRRSVVRDQP
jgi:low affinity Fe/Cu permease